MSKVMDRILAGELTLSEEEAYVFLNYAISCLERAKEHLGIPESCGLMMNNLGMAKHFIKEAMKKAL